MIEFSAPPTVWLVTYLVHSTLALALVWALERAGLLRATRARELFWRVALLGPLLSATLRATGLVLALPVSAQPALALARLVVGTNPALAASSAAAPGLPEAELGLARLGHVLDLLGLLWILWAALASLFLARLAWRARVLLRTAAPVPAELAARWNLLCARRGLRAPRLLTSPSLSGPVTLPRGGVRLPPWVASELSAREQEALLLHELAHHARRDAAWRVLALLLEAVLWLQPLVRLARRRLEALAELAADAWAREAGADGRALAECLVTCAARPRRAFALASALDGPGSLSERVERLLAPPLPGPPPAALLRACAGLGLLGLLFAAPGCDPSSLRSGNRTSVTTDDSGAVEVTIERAGYRLELTCDVPFVAADGAPELVTLERDGRFSLHELHAGHTSLYQLTRHEGRLAEAFERDDAPADFDAAARAWVRETLTSIGRETSFSPATGKLASGD